MEIVHSFVPRNPVSTHFSPHSVSAITLARERLSRLSDAELKTFILDPVSLALALMREYVSSRKHSFGKPGISGPLVFHGCLLAIDYRSIMIYLLALALAPPHTRARRHAWQSETGSLVASPDREMT